MLLRTFVIALASFVPVVAGCSNGAPNHPYVGLGGNTTGNTATSTHTTGMGCSLANGIVGWWAAEDDATDLLGKANGTWTGTPAYQQGKIGQGFAFSGNGYVRAPVMMTGPMTIDLWAMSIAANEATYDAAFSTGDVASAPFFQIDSDGAGNYRVFAQASFNVGPIVDSVFQHLAVTFDGSTAVAYLDGKVAGMVSWTGLKPLAFSTLKIGTNRATSTSFRGVVDEVHVWNRALSAAEITTLAAIDGPSLCP